MYDRLQKVGFCLSHTATILAIKKMGKNHDKMIRDWSYLLNSDSAHQNEPECNENEEDKSDDGVDDEVIPRSYSGDSIPTDATVSIIGDNLDKNIKPRYMTINHQVKSLHLFHSVAAVGRIKTLHLDEEESVADTSDIPVSSFLPSTDDCVALCNNFVILAARVVVENFTCFSSLCKCVPDHIQHKYSAFMKEKTVSVSGLLYL